MHSGLGTRRVRARRGQPFSPKRRKKKEPNPFRRTASGFENLIPKDGSEDFFFSQWIETPEKAAEILEHGGDERDPLLGDPRAGLGVSAILHVLFVAFLLFQPTLNELFDWPIEPSEEVLQTDEREPLVLFMEEEPPAEPPPVAVVPAIPVAPEQAQPQPPPKVADNRLVIPKAMIQPDTHPDIMNDLPYSVGNTDEFYTKEEVKDPGTEGEPETPPEPEPLVADAEAGEDDVTAEAVEGPDTAEENPALDDLSGLVFGEKDPEEEPEQPGREESLARRDVPPPRRPIEAASRGEGGENGRFTDIRRFLAGAQFHNPEGGLVANNNNTMYYNDKGANFVPWIRRMLTEISRTWRAGMPWAANIYHGHVAVGFSVDREGNVIDYRTLVPSGVAGFDNIAVGAIRAADLLPLPNDYPDPTFDIIIVFWYNERPYDIFG